MLRRVQLSVAHRLAASAKELPLPARVDAGGPARAGVRAVRLPCEVARPAGVDPGLAGCARRPNRWPWTGRESLPTQKKWCFRELTIWAARIPHRASFGCAKDPPQRAAVLHLAPASGPGGPIPNGRRPGRRAPEHHDHRLGGDSDVLEESCEILDGPLVDNPAVIPGSDPAVLDAEALVRGRRDPFPFAPQAHPSASSLAPSGAEPRRPSHRLPATPPY